MCAAQLFSNDGIYRHLPDLDHSTLQVKGSYKVEVEEFEMSKAFSKMMERVNGRVGLQLDKEEARLMWNICR